MYFTSELKAFRYRAMLFLCTSTIPSSRRPLFFRLLIHGAFISNTIILIKTRTKSRMKVPYWFRIVRWKCLLRFIGRLLFTRNICVFVVIFFSSLAFTIDPVRRNNSNSTLKLVHCFENISHMFVLNQGSHIFDAKFHHSKIMNCAPEFCYWRGWWGAET